SILMDCLTFTIATGQEESRRDGLETINAIRDLKALHPDVQTTLGLSNISFGLNPAARQVLNSVFLHECVAAGLDSAIVHASKIVPISRIPDEQREVALDLVYDRRSEGYDPLTRFLDLFEGVAHASKIVPISRIPDEQREVALDLVYDRRSEGYDPLTRFLDLFEGVSTASTKATRAQELAALPLEERLQRR